MKKAILAVSFGTTHQDTLEKTIAAIEKDLAAGFPDRDLFRAFTSGMVIRRLKERDGVAIDNVSEALEQLLGRFEYALVAALCAAVALVLLSVMLPLLGVLSAVGG